MRFVHDHQVPFGRFQRAANVFLPRIRNRRQRKIGLTPDIQAIQAFLVEIFPGNDGEILAELGQQFAAPLGCQRGRCDNQHPADALPPLELLDEQPSHDRFARAGIMRQQGAHHRAGQQVFVDGFKLVGKWINPAGVQAGVGVERMGQPQSQRLNPKSKALRVAGKWQLTMIGLRHTANVSPINRREHHGAGGSARWLKDGHHIIARMRGDMEYLNGPLPKRSFKPVTWLD